MCRTKLEPKPRRRFSFSKTNSFMHLCTVIYKALKRKSVVALKNAHNPTKTKAIATPYPITSSAKEISACYIWLLRHLRHFSSVTLQCQQHVYVVMCVYTPPGNLVLSSSMQISATLVFRYKSCKAWAHAAFKYNSINCTDQS